MKVWATALLVLITLTDPTRISKINTLKAEAKKAYLKNDFKTAISKYRYLIDSMDVREDEVLLNLASAYYNLKDTTNAVSQYQSLTASSKNQLRSKAQQQLGLIADQQGKQEEALNHFKEAIKSDLTNEEARYNYELLKKKLEEKKKQDQKKQDQNKDQDKKDQDKKDQDKKDQEKKDQQKKDQEQKDKEKKEQEEKEKQDQQKKDQDKKDQEKKDQEKKEQEEKEKKDEEKKMPPSVKEKLEQMKISPEKAEMLLEAMRNQEKQYLQQNKRKATKPKEKGKPDW
ncbi:MAG: tetratricopeptide repeat protein [Cyclobacteriaceae bacterium]